MLHDLSYRNQRLQMWLMSGRNRERPGLYQSLAACRACDTLWSPSSTASLAPCPTPRDIVEDLTQRTIKLSLGGNVHDPTEPVRRLLFNVLAMVAEFEYDLT